MIKPFLITPLLICLAMTSHAQPVNEIFATSPAEHWVEAYPVGNGRLGAMVFGGVAEERFTLNDDTLWSGYPKDNNNPDSLAALPEVRRLLFEGDLVAAQRATMRMQGAFTQSYMPLGDLNLTFAHDGEATEYRRSLDMDRGIVTTRYRVGETVYTREVFASFPDQVLVVRLTAEGPDPIRVSAGLNSQLQHTAQPGSPDTIVIQGTAPSHVEPDYRGDIENAVVYNQPEGEGTRFTTRLHARGGEGFTVEQTNGQLTAQADDSVTLLLTTATSFNGFDRSPGLDGRDHAALSQTQLEQAISQSTEDLLQTHTADHSALFGRVSLTLSPSRDETPTEDRINTYTPESDPGLLGLVYQFGRYLLIASSRPGSQPANLQGIWNKDLRPAWSCNYTININAEMNYWLAETTNLSECTLPFISFVEGLAVRGEDTARINYGADGWVAHHNSDIWRSSNPVGDFGRGHPCWAMWPMGAVWMCEPVWEHYAFSGDEAYLRERAYPFDAGCSGVHARLPRRGPARKQPVPARHAGHRTIDISGKHLHPAQRRSGGGRCHVHAGHRADP